MRVVERLGQHVRSLVDSVEREPVLPLLERLRADQRGDLRHGRGLPHDEVLLIAELGRAEQPAPIDTRSFLVEVARGSTDCCAVVLSWLGFERFVRLGDLISSATMRPARSCASGSPARVRISGDVRRIVGTDLGHVRPPDEIIIAVRQSEASLQHVRHRPGRVIERLRDEHAEQVLGVEIGLVERIGVGAQRMADRLAQRRLCPGSPRSRSMSGLIGASPRAVDRGRVDDRQRNNWRSARRSPLVGWDLTMSSNDRGVALFALRRRAIENVRCAIGPAGSEPSSPSLPLAYLSKSSPGFDRRVHPATVDARLLPCVCRASGIAAGVGVAGGERECGRDEQRAERFMG